MQRLAQFTRIAVEYLAVFLFGAILVLQTLNIFLRYTGIANPLMWVEEASTFSFIWILFLLWHVADREDSHFVVDFFRDRLSSRARSIADLFAHGVALAFAGLVVWSSTQFIPTAMLYRTNSFNWLPMGVVYLVLPIGFTLVVIERILKLIDAWRSLSRSI